ncbi:hypothetical protein KIW84_061331 [Lathyrus oleraceus]|uniref:Uncharacterized protein n=1 Tax=Pisum sativum TaxID=3888 RepID=A0A9D4W475_PEA|nr:hypothetical protein KIW84_061331 [Pisum sativum]
MTTSLLSPHERVPSISVLAGIDRVILVQFNIGPIDIYPVTQDGQIPSRSLMSLSMLRGVPINCLYGYPVTDNVGSAIKHSTLHLGSIVVSGRRVVYTIITMRTTYDTLHNFLYSILIAGQSGVVVACQVVWLLNLLRDLKIKVNKPLKLMIDNKSAINLAKNPVLHRRNKHIETKYHFLRSQVHNGVLEVMHNSTQKQLTDVQTKAIKTDQFFHLRDEIGVISFD